MTLPEILQGLGITSPTEQQQLQARLQNDVFERFVYKVVSVGRADDIATIRSFLTTHTDTDREKLWALMNDPYYAQLLAESWEEQLLPLLSENT